MEESIFISSALEGFKLFVCDKKKGFISGKFECFLDDKTVQLKIEGSNEIKQFPLSQTYTPNFEDNKDFDDNCMMDSPNPATLFFNIKDRFLKNKIYTYISNILIAINPYKQINNLYTNEMIEKYYNKSYDTLPPHIYAIANKASNDIKNFKKDQTIIISGESGSGKTETQKEVLKYVCNIWGNDNKTIQKKILYSNLILESFGNAITIRNKNSSRFVKYILINFDNDHKIIGGKVLYYLLERSRIICQSKYESNYHIFYQLILGVNDKWKEEFKIKNIDQFEYLSKECQFILNYKKDCIIDDVNSYSKLIEALKEIGYNYDNIKEIFKILSGILHLGNIKFYQKINDGECEIENENSLEQVSILFGFKNNLLKNALKYRKICVSRNMNDNDPILIHLKCTEAINSRDALAKKIYTKLFDNIVLSINNKIKPSSDEYRSLNVLDIAGFEIYKKNCFEQLCINYTNEKLQHFFNKIIFINNQKLFNEENVNIETVYFTDNIECIQLFDSKFDGIFTLLNEEAHLPQPSSIHFTESVFRRNNTNKYLTTGRKYNMKEYKDIKDNEGFVIHHYANDVFYDTKNFIEKNNDNLHSSLEDFLQQSTNIYFKQLFYLTNVKKTSKLNSPTISLTFKHQLDNLLEKLESTGINFIRCIKPNDSMDSNIFDDNKVIKQLSCSGINDALFIMNIGYPCRIGIDELYQKYEVYLCEWMKKIDHRIFLIALFNVIELDKKMYKFGLTKIFFKNGIYGKFDKMIKNEEIVNLIDKIKYYFIKKRWKKIIFSIFFIVDMSKNITKKNNAAIIIQAYVKGFLLRKKIKKILKLYKEMCNFSKILDKEILWIKNFNSPKKTNLWKQVNHIFILILKAKSCCKELNSKKIRYLIRDRSEISSKMLHLSLLIKNAISEVESKKRLDIEENKDLNEHYDLKSIDEKISKILDEKEKFAIKHKQLKDSIKKFKNKKDDIICSIEDYDLYDISEFEKKLNEKLCSKNKDVPKVIKLYDEKELKNMSFQNLKQNLDTLVDKERREQCKEEIEKRYSQLKKLKITQK